MRGAVPILLLLAIAGQFLFVGCDVKPRKIDYGKTNCHYCRMSIVDKIHASEIVTRKGKIYMFDSAECMVHFSNTFDTSQIKMYLTNTYTRPEALADATKATFLVSKKIPSPMGAFLTAFESLDAASKVQGDIGGILYTWEELKALLE